jgi:hypothetical protein
LRPLSPSPPSASAGRGIVRTHRPGVQQLQLQAQLRGLLLRRPVAGIGGGACGQPVDERDERAQHLLAGRRRPVRPLAPALCQAALEQAHVLFVYPGVDALHALVCGDLAPERGPEGALGATVLIHRQRLGEQCEQIGAGGRAGRMGEPLVDASQDQPQRGDDDVLLALEVVRQHPGGVAGLARDAHHARLVEAVLGDHAAGDQGNLVASLRMVDDLRHRAMVLGITRAVQPRARPGRGRRRPPPPDAVRVPDRGSGRRAGRRPRTPAAPPAWRCRRRRARAPPAPRTGC